MRRIREYLLDDNRHPSARLTRSENLAAPVVRFAWEELRQAKRLELLSGNAASALRDSLRSRLALIAHEVTTSELKLPHSGNCTKRKDRNRPIQDPFFGAFAKDTLQLLENYPGLARLWSVQVEWWQRFVTDFVNHARSFVRRKNNTSATVAAIVADLSDPHCEGRTVMRVRFVPGGDWYYKPRTGCQEVAWFKLLRRLNNEGFSLPFLIVRTESGNQHSWMEAVRARSCVNRTEERRLWYRSGALSYLIHLLRGVDFHEANLIVSGDQPVFVDVETLLHPNTSLPTAFRAEDTSILRTGLFPVSIPTEGSHYGFAKLRRSSRGAAGLYSERTMPSELVDELITGFEAMHAFVTAKPHRKRYIRRLAVGLAKLPGRIIHRPTRQYVSMLAASLAPTLMRDEFQRTVFLLTACTEDAGSPEQTLTEYQALENADIPVFVSLRRRVQVNFHRMKIRPSVHSAAM